MTTSDGLDDKWIRDGLEKRRANFSNVICFETKDPQRRDQLVRFLRSAQDYAGSQIFKFEPWTGLGELGKNGRFEPVTRPSGGSYDPGLSSTYKNIREALQYMDSVLKDRKSVLLLELMEPAQAEGRSEALVQAVRSWAHEAKIMTVSSLIVLLVGGLTRVLDELTGDLVGLSRAPSALPAERAALIERTARDLGVRVEEDHQDLILAAAGLSIHQLKCALVEAYHLDKAFRVERLERLKADQIRRSELLELEDPLEGGFSDVGGYDAVKRFVYDCLIRVLKDQTRAEKLDLPLPRGILFFGPPGTGKTLFAKALAKETVLPFINFRTENLYSKYLGESGHRFRDAILLAEQMSPAIVFVDEIDKFGKRGEGGGGGASQETRRVFNQVLEWLGDANRKSIVLGATNRPKDLDAAFLRPGRFDYKIPFLYPSESGRREILKIHLGLKGSRSLVPMEFESGARGDIAERIAAETEGLSGAEVEQLVARAKRLAFASGADTVASKHLFEALARLRVDPEKRSMERDEFLKLAEEFTDDLDFPGSSASGSVTETSSAGGVRQELRDLKGFLDAINLPGRSWPTVALVLEEEQQDRPRRKSHSHLRRRLSI